MRQDSLIPMILAMSSMGSMPGTITHGNGGQKAKVNRPDQSDADASHHLEKARLKRQRRIERNKRLAEKKEQV